MNIDLRRQMLAYYNERAPEYEEAYTRGTGTASIRDPKVFITEAVVLGEIVSRCVSGRILDRVWNGLLAEGLRATLLARHFD